MPGSTGDEWLSTQEAARRMGITARTLYRLIDEGEVPAYKFGRVLRLKTADVDAYIEACRVEPGTLANLYPPRREPVPKPRTERQRDVERDATIVAAYTAGGTVESVAATLRVGQATVIKALNDAGIERKRGPRR